MFKPLELQDCQNIAKTFEKAAAYCVTEESVFAMMTPLLTGIRTQSSSIFKQLEASEHLSNPKSTAEKNRERAGGASSPLGDEESGMNMSNMDKADSEDEGFLTKIKGNFFPADAAPGAYPNDPGEGIAPGMPANIAGGIFNSECIPCGERLNMLGELDASKFFDLGKDYLQNWINWLTQQLQMLMDLVGVFTNTDNFVDLCALLKWMSDFICIPDLQRMLSVLMALMSRMSLEFGGVLDIILGLIGPLLTPILSGFVDLLQSYVLIIVRPIECIIDSIQDIIRKLDYNVLFQNIDSLDKHASIGSDAPVNVSVKIPFVDTEVRYELPETGKAEADYNLAGPVADAIKRKNAEDQAAIENAAKELKAIRAASSDVDMADPAAVARYKTQKAQAEENYRRAIEEKSLSEVGEINVKIDRTVSQMKSALFTLIGYLREAAAAVEGFFQDVFDELKKIQGAYVGGGGTFVEQLIKKIGLVQMIGFISAVISAFASGIKCGDDDEDLKIEGFLPKEQGFNVWTDEQGTIHIMEADDDFADAVDAMVEAAVSATTSLRAEDNVEEVKERDKGESPDKSMQKLKTLVEFTGDPVLDTQIARVTESLVTQVNVTFKCPLQTGVEEAEQVNRWIQELNSI